MKSIILTFIALVIVMFTAKAQSQEDFDALASFIPTESLQAIQESNFLEYQQMAYLNRHGYHLSSFGNKEMVATSPLSSVEKRYETLPDITSDLIESGELNLLGYNFTIYPDKYNYYSIEGSSDVLAIPPGKVVLKKANLLND